MDQTYIREIFQPDLKDPILVVGLPGVGNIGRDAAKHLIDHSRAKLFAELYSPSFPDLVFIDRKGICRPPRYEFYASTTGKSLVILIGDNQPPPEEVPAHYEVCSDVLDFAAKLRCSFIIALDGAPSPHPTGETYIAATSARKASQYAKKGALVYKGGRIVAASGLLLGLAEKRGLEGICLIAPTLGLTVDREASVRIYKFLKRVLETDV